MCFSDFLKKGSPGVSKELPGHHFQLQLYQQTPDPPPSAAVTCMTCHPQDSKRRRLEEIAPPMFGGPAQARAHALASQLLGSQSPAVSAASLHAPLQNGEANQQPVQANIPVPAAQQQPHASIDGGSVVSSANASVKLGKPKKPSRSVVSGKVVSKKAAEGVELSSVEFLVAKDIGDLS